MPACVLVMNSASRRHLEMDEMSTPVRMDAQSQDDDGYATAEEARVDQDSDDEEGVSGAPVREFFQMKEYANRTVNRYWGRDGLRRQYGKKKQSPQDYVTLLRSDLKAMRANLPGTTFDDVADQHELVERLRALWPEDSSEHGLLSLYIEQTEGDQHNVEEALDVLADNLSSETLWQDYNRVTQLRQ